MVTKLLMRITIPDTIPELITSVFILMYGAVSNIGLAAAIMRTNGEISANRFKIGKIGKRPAVISVTGKTA
jgi:hypothetical protein